MDDMAVKKNITDQLVWDGRLQGSDIKVEYQNGIVRLWGTVPNYFAKNAAESDALQVKGVLAVKNELSVKQGDPDLPSDQEVKERVEDVIYWNNNIDYAKVDVLIDNHIITLVGMVDALWKVYLAEELALTVRGVTQVVNKLSVVPTKNRKDENIAHDLMSALERNSDIDEERVVVRVDHGNVYLEGSVNFWREKESINKIAMYTRGVKDIKNDVTVRSGTDK